MAANWERAREIGLARQHEAMLEKNRRKLIKTQGVEDGNLETEDAKRRKLDLDTVQD